MLKFTKLLLNSSNVYASYIICGGTVYGIKDIIMYYI